MINFASATTQKHQIFAILMRFCCSVLSTIIITHSKLISYIVKRNFAL